jgi:hypothetical protein
VPIVIAPNFINHILMDLKSQIDLNTVVVGDCNTPLSPIDSWSRFKNKTKNNSRVKWHHRLKRPDRHLLSIPSWNSTIHSSQQPMELSPKWAYLWSQSLNKYKKTEITPCILSDHNAIKLELNNKRSNRKYSNNWRLNITLLYD